MSSNHQRMSVSWDNHLKSLGIAFPAMLAGGRFVDVTLACEGRRIHCHRVVLAACSSYFADLLEENPAQHPIIILPKDVKFWTIQALIQFIYKGEVSVTEAGFTELVKCAEILQIHSLNSSQNNQDYEEEPLAHVKTEINSEPEDDTTAHYEMKQEFPSSSQWEEKFQNHESMEPVVEIPKNCPLVNPSSSRNNRKFTKNPKNCQLPPFPPKNFILPRSKCRKFDASAMWSALMSVKSGMSSYRASKVYKVSNKSLQNYMKMYGIKSSYPEANSLKMYRLAKNCNK
ncbi:hypothetical protein DMENIID0001_058410 [Sergentomyia squamirostris]